MKLSVWFRIDVQILLRLDSCLCSKKEFLPFGLNWQDCDASKLMHCALWPTVYSLLAHVTFLIRIQISSDKYLKKTWTICNQNRFVAAF